MLRSHLVHDRSSRGRRELKACNAAIPGVDSWDKMGSTSECCARDETSSGIVTVVAGILWPFDRIHAPIFARISHWIENSGSFC